MAFRQGLPVQLRLGIAASKIQIEYQTVSPDWVEHSVPVQQQQRQLEPKAVQRKNRMEPLWVVQMSVMKIGQRKNQVELLWVLK